MQDHREGDQQPGEQMDAVNKLLELAVAQPVLVHQLAAAHRHEQGHQGERIGGLPQPQPAGGEGVQGQQQGDRPEQKPHRAVNVDPLTGRGEGEPAKTPVVHRVHQHAREPGQRHQQGRGAMQQAQQGGLVRTGHSG